MKGKISQVFKHDRDLTARSLEQDETTCHMNSTRSYLTFAELSFLFIWNNYAKTHNLFQV